MPTLAASLLLVAVFGFVSTMRALVVGALIGGGRAFMGGGGRALLPAARPEKWLPAARRFGGSARMQRQAASVASFELLPAAPRLAVKEVASLDQGYLRYSFDNNWDSNDPE